jgi:hypothetical protein
MTTSGEVLVRYDASNYQLASVAVLNAKQFGRTLKEEALASPILYRSLQIRPRNMVLPSFLGHKDLLSNCNWQGPFMI